jgi:hypothetical protein
VPLGLRPGVSFCEASGHLIFLDIAADRYFALDGPADAAFRRLLGPPAPHDDRQPLDRLAESQLLVEAPDALPVRPCPLGAAGRKSLLEQTLPPASISAVLRALGGVAAARFALRAGGLAAALRGTALQKVRIPAGASDPTKIEAEASAFDRCTLLIRSHDQCLVRSLALVRRLAARGERTDLVIGVRVRPFSAHAWVQKGDLLLNERCDAVRGYTPILIL